jgi:hypothetical protein
MGRLAGQDVDGREGVMPAGATADQAKERTGVLAQVADADAPP